MSTPPAPTSTGPGRVGRATTIFALALIVGLGGTAAAATAQVPDTLDGARYGTLDGRRATLRFAEADSLVATRVLALLDGQEPLPGLPLPVPSGVTAVLAHTPAAFDQLTGGVVPEWRAGVAIPSERLLVVPTGEGTRILDGEGLRTLRHEWAHLGLHEYLGELRVPRWFDEGYAQWSSGGFDASEAWRLRVLLAMGRSPAMDSLTLSWPAGREEARTAYLLAASAVGYLLEPSGTRGLELFLGRWRDGGSFDDALVTTFGVTSDQLEGHWRTHVRKRYGWLFVLSHSALFWIVLVLVLFLLVRVRRTRDRERLARLRATELPDDPAFWMDTEGSNGPEEPTAGV